MKKSNPFIRLFMQLGKAIQMVGAKREQIIASIVTFCMVFAMLPIGSIVVSASTTATERADFYSNPTKAIELLGTGASWEAASKTLTLKNVKTMLNYISMEMESELVMFGSRVVTQRSWCLVLPGRLMVIINRISLINHPLGSVSIKTVAKQHLLEI